MVSANQIKIILLAEDKASDVADKVGTSLEKSFGGKLLKGAAVGLTAVGASMAAVGAGAFKLAQDAAPLLGVRQAFYGVAEAADFSAGEMLAALKESSAGMITNRDLMTSFNKAAQLVSVDFAQKLPDAMGMLGKVAEATGQDVGYMLDSLVTGVGRLSPMILDNLGIQVDMTAAMEDYAEVNGLVVSEMSKQEQQAALMNQVLQKLGDNTAAMPDLADSATAKFANFGVAMQDLKDTIGLSLLPVVTPFMEKLSELASRYIPKVIEAIQPFLHNISLIVENLLNFETTGEGLRGMLENFMPPEVVDGILAFVEGFKAFGQTVIEVVQTNVLPILETLWGWLQMLLPIALQMLSDYWNGILLPTLQNVFNWIQTYVVPLLTVIWEIIQNVLPPAIQALSDFWSNVLYPAIKTVFDWIWANVMPALGEIFLWVAQNLPPAIQKLSDFWKNVLYPALLNLFQWVQTYVIPVLIDVFTWIAENFPPAIQTLSDFWQNTLLPAIQTVYDFIVAYIVPILETLVEIIGTTLKLAIQVLAGIWENVLKPALEVVWDFVQTKVTPALTWLHDKVIKPLADTIGGALTSALEYVSEKLKVFSDWLKSITIPDWLVPGSPTPFELGIRGITKALEEVNRRALPEFSFKMSAIPDIQFAGAGYSGRALPTFERITQNQQTVTILGGLNLTGVQDTNDFLEEINRLMV